MPEHHHAKHALERVRERRTADAALGDDAGDQTRAASRRTPGSRSSRPSGASAGRRTWVTSRASRSSMRNVRAVRRLEVDRRERRRDVERDAVLARRAPPPSRCRSCWRCRRWRRCDRRRRRRSRPCPGASASPAMLSVISVVSMPSRTQLPGGQPCALQHGPRLVGEHRHLLAGGNRAADDARARCRSRRSRARRRCSGSGCGRPPARPRRRRRPSRGSWPRLRRESRPPRARGDAFS